MSRYRTTMKDLLEKVNQVEIDEGKMKTIATMFDQGQSAREIAKALKLPISTVKSILGEGINPYISMQRDKNGKMNYVVLDKDEKEAFRSLNYTLAQNFFKKNFNKLKEETIYEFSDSMLDKLAREYEPLKGKTISIDQANKLRKIFDKIPDRALDALRRKKIPFLSGLALSRMIKKGMPVKEELEETPQGYALVQKAKEIAKKMANNYSGAVKEIEKLQKGLSNNSSVKDALMKANESLDENRVNDIKKKAKEFGVDVSVDAMGPFKSKQVNVKGFKTQSGMDKFMKYVADMGKDFLTIKDELEEKIQPFMISYSKNGQHAGFEGGNSLSDIQNKAQKLRAKGFTIDKMGRYSPPVGDMFMKKFARKEEYIKEEEMPKEEPKKEKDKKAEEENKDTQIRRLIDQIAILKTKLENEKNKAVKPEPNPDTGEVPLTVGVAYKHFKDKKEKQEVKEATVVSDISGISIPALKRETAKFNIKVARVTPGGPMGAEYEVTFTGAEKDLIAYAKEHFGFDDKPGTFQQLKKHLNMDYVPESASQVQTRSDGKGNFNLMFRGKEIGYYHKERGKYVVYHSKEDGEYSESDVVSTPTQAKKMAYDNMTEADLTKSQIKQVHKVADDLPKKDFKDRYGKEKGDAVRFGTATNMVKKKLGIKEDRRLYVETIAGLKKKAEKSGMPYSILKKVYDRGMAAWKSGHRPGASQQQWAFARVNSFVTKSSGTWGGADKDLAKQVRGSK